MNSPVKPEPVKPEKMVMVRAVGPSEKGVWIHAGAEMKAGDKLEVTESQAASLVAAGHAVSV